MWIDSQAQRESSPLGGLNHLKKKKWKSLIRCESLLWGISSRFPLASHFDSPHSKSASGIYPGPPMCVPCMS